MIFRAFLARMGGKNKNKKVQPYAVFVSEEAKRLGISTQEAFDRCGDTWKNMTDDERQRYVTLMRNFNTSTYYRLFLAHFADIHRF